MGEDMQTIQFIYFACDGWVGGPGAVQNIKGGSLVMGRPDIEAASNHEGALFVYSYTMGDLHALYREICEALAPAALDGTFVPASTRILPIPAEIGVAVRYLGSKRPLVLLKFLWLYGLALDEAYFNRMLVYSISNSRSFFEFVEANSLKAWPVSFYAARLGISVRKLNQLFRDHYGTSAKRWLIERRLAHARDMLLRTSMTVTEIALESGFNSHAHFTDTFKKRYHHCPRTVRQTI